MIDVERYQIRARRRTSTVSEKEKRFNPNLNRILKNRSMKDSRQLALGRDVCLDRAEVFGLGVLPAKRLSHGITSFAPYLADYNISF